MNEVEEEQQDEWNNYQEFTDEEWAEYGGGESEQKEGCGGVFE